MTIGVLGLAFVSGLDVIIFSVKEKEGEVVRKGRRLIVEWHSAVVEEWYCAGEEKHFVFVSIMLCLPVILS